MRFWGELVGMKRNWIRVLAWLMCLALTLGVSAPAFAQEIQIRGVSPDESASLGTQATDAAAETARHDSILDNAAITAMVEDYLAKKNVPADRVGIGYCYTATGDEWFHNPDSWFYPGSMYKVPLMMILSERVRSGEVSSDTQIGGLDLDTVFEYILVYSNNDYAHKVRTFLGGDEQWREEAKQYARLDSYDERYMLYCYFSPRYMTQVFETLYKAPEKFPNVTDKLLEAEQGHYFRLPDAMHPYDVAQKYGSYLDNEGSDWNHTAGIVYTENPFILTVMTKNVGGSESFIGELASLFKDYTLGVDAQYAAYQKEQEAQEAERLAAEQAAMAAAAEQAAQTPNAAAKPGPTPVPQQPQTEAERRTHALELSDRARRTGIIVLEILLVAAIAGGIAAVIIVKEKERRRYESYRRRFEAELRQEAMERERAARAQQTQRPRAPAAPAEAPPQKRAAAPARPVRQSVQPPVKPVQHPTVQPKQPQARPSFDESLWEEDDEDE